MLRKSRGKFMSHLSNLLEFRETHSVNLESSIHCREKMLGVLKSGNREKQSIESCPVSKDKFSENVSGSYISVSEAGTRGDGDVLIGKIEYASSSARDIAEDLFDHSNCHDCTYVHSLTTDCTVHLETLCTQVSGADSLTFVVDICRTRIILDATNIK